MGKQKLEAKHYLVMLVISALIAMATAGISALIRFIQQIL